MGVKVHFLNVGSGDCTIIHFPERKRNDGVEKPERIMMIDIYHHDEHEEYENVINYYKENFKNSDGSIKSIFRFVLTHPHQDHICGLDKLFSDNNISVINFWDTNNNFEPTDFDGHETHEDDWNKYQEIRKKESDPKVLTNYREDSPTKYWDDDEDRITILSPTKSLENRAHKKEDGSDRDKDKIEIDEMSYAIKIKINSRSIIIAGDGRESPVWNDIYDDCKNEIENTTILKAGHHGQNASFHEDAVKKMDPQYIVFSNSKNEDKENGAEKDYKKACPNVKILKTHIDGTIVMDIPFDDNAEIEVS